MKNRIKNTTRITLKDIASFTGTSINTVSRALKDMPDIGEQTKERIRDAAKALGYTPNVMARSLVTKRSYTIGAIVTLLENPSRANLINKLRHIAAAKGFQLMIASYDTSSEAEKHIIEMAGRGVDGLIFGNIDGILAEQEFWPALDMISNTGTPIVTFFNTLTTKIDNIFVDFAAIAEKLTTHLIKTHQLNRISFIGQGTSCSRWDGYHKAMLAAGLENETNFIELGYYSLPETKQGIINYIRKNGAPEGIVCHNDLTAIGIISGLRELNIKVPEEVAVVGIDNIDISSFINPSLTKVGIDPDLLAEKLFHLLEDRIEDNYSGQARRVELPFEIYPRESCGCS